MAENPILYRFSLSEKLRSDNLLALKDETDSLSRNVGKKYHSSLSNKAVQGSLLLFRGRRLKSRILKTLPVNSHTFLFLQHNIY